ncbi:hypothetical protein NKJ10_00140 [Mesorhizobium sp. M0204]|uniref:hypothetical protein n=1 Tax=Mesorhizobium sp. M0204 TaxID=2956913 RepID=UPI00333B232C
MTVNLPDENPKRLLARRLFDAVVSEIPFLGGPFAAMLSVTHPQKIEQLQGKWQADVTDALNNMDKIINDLVPTIPLSDLALSIGIWTSQISKLGRGEMVDFSALQSQFPDVSKLVLEDALGELAHVGLLRLAGAIGHKIIHYRPTIEFYEVFDSIAFDGANPRADAARAARFILLEDGTVGADSIMAEFGWEARRYNPAMAIISTMIGEGRRSGEIHPTIDCRYVGPNSSERAALRHFANTILGPA